MTLIPLALVLRQQGSREARPGTRSGHCCSGTLTGFLKVEIHVAKGWGLFSQGLSSRKVLNMGLGWAYALGTKATCKQQPGMDMEGRGAKLWNLLAFEGT